jgi:hypothetical protein
VSARADVSFESGGEHCAAWLYHPEHASACIVMVPRLS